MNEYILWIFILASIVIIVVLIVLHLFRKNEDTKDIKENISILSPNIYAFLVRLGLLKTSALSHSFINALHKLKSTISGSDYKYAVPWYLVVGSHQSGKSTLLDSLAEFSLPGNDYNGADSENSLCKWFFYTNAIAIEVTSTIFDTGFSNRKINNNWQFLAKQLAYYRPRRPLDGIVLTIPCDYLKKEEDYPGANKILAQNIFENLWWLQAKLNVRLPIYCVITKVDEVSGMLEFLENLTIEQKNQLLGWSSPYAIDEAYSMKWIDEAFSYIKKSVNNVILKIAVSSSSHHSFEGALFVVKHLNDIKEKIKTFTNSIFGPHDRNEGLVFRGIYFTGSESVTANKFGLPNPTIGDISSRRSSIAFVKDLFCQKIFVEYNIAQPIFRNFLFNKTRILVKRMIMLFITLSLLIGGYFSYGRITETFDALQISLMDINLSVKKLKSIDVTKKNNLENEVKNILSLITKMDTENLKSVFVPWSWFIDINSMIRQSISNSFDTAIVNSLYYDLKLRSDEIVVKIESKVSDSSQLNLNFTALDEFKDLVTYVTKVLELQKAEDKYNKLLERDRGEYLSTVTKFLFSEQYQVDKFLNQKMKDKAVHPTFSLTIYSEVIRENIKVLFDNFIKACFTKSYQKIFQNVQNSIENLVAELNDINVDIRSKAIRELYNKLTVLIEFISSKENEWMSGTSFRPGKKYDNLFVNLSEIYVIDKKFLEELSGYADESLLIFKSSLAKYNTNCTGGFLKRIKNNILMSVANKFLQFYNDLGILLKEKFVVDAEAYEVCSVIPETKRLFWNPDLLSTAGALIKEYNDFKNVKSKAMLSSNNVIYLGLAKRVLRGVVSSLVARSQNLENRSTDTNDLVRLTSLKSNVTNMVEVKSNLISIIEFMDMEFSGVSGALLKLVSKYYTRILDEMDAIFERNKPYEMKANMFATWDGENKANLHALNLVNDIQVSEYCTVQRDILELYTKHIAEPLIDFLGHKQIPNLGSAEFLIAKWREMTAFMNDYLNKIPGNSISMLENFLTTYLGNVTYDNFNVNDVVQKYNIITRDYFLSRRSKMATDLTRRVFELKHAKYLESYNKVAEYFNKNLSGRYPFVKLANIYTSDSQIEPVEEFLKLFNGTINNDVKELFKKIVAKQPSGIYNDALKFINSIELNKPLLEVVVASAKRLYNNKSKLLCTVKFRSVPREEVGSEQLINYKFSIGTGEISYLDKQNQPLQWYSGDDISCTFVWAQNSYELPSPSRNTQYSVLGQEAVFSFKGIWSIVRLLTSSVFLGEAYPGDGVVLKFDVNTLDKRTGAAKRTAKLFLKVKLEMEGIDNALKNIGVPRFPDYAPILKGF